MTTTTLADLAHTCRERAARLVEQADEWDTLGETGSADVDRDAAADWQALCDLAECEIVHPDRLVEAARRLAARLDRPASTKAQKAEALALSGRRPYDELVHSVPDHCHTWWYDNVYASANADVPPDIHTCAQWHAGHLPPHRCCCGKTEDEKS